MQVPTPYQRLHVVVGREGLHIWMDLDTVIDRRIKL
jgi:hypothetical protein